MDRTRQIAHEFKGIRLEINSGLSFDEVLRRLKDQTGESTVSQVNEVASNSRSAEEFDAEVTRRFVGPSGFMLFAKIDHSGWIKKYGINRRVLRVILGNPLFAITMMREEISAGLFAPVEILLVESGIGSTLHYVRPSTLMVIDDNAPLKKAALELDRKLELLISNITGLADS
ncbi:MAG TPA: DUF302 domain-containing protein [Bryobacteraceae bacterium]|jgi:uncharacterized protein (DUF302 family)|nr:DUF302 domain-containing protein [Bryobacteraceae bacterium]